MCCGWLTIICNNCRAHWYQSADRADTLAGREVARTLDRAANIWFQSYSLFLQRVIQGLTTDKTYNTHSIYTQHDVSPLNQLRQASWALHISVWYTHKTTPTQWTCRQKNYSTYPHTLHNKDKG